VQLDSQNLAALRRIQVRAVTTGRTAVRADMTTQVQFQAADSTTAMGTVSIMFPANCRTVVRLMDAWYDAQVGLSIPRSGCRTVQPYMTNNQGACTRHSHAPKQPSLLPAHFTLAHCDHKGGPCQPSSTAADGMLLTMSCTKATLPLPCTLHTCTL
jgi:hypothetical protein